MTTAEAAKELGVSHRAVQRAIKSGRLTAQRIGKRLFVVSADDLAKFRERGGKLPPPAALGAAPPLAVLSDYYHRIDHGPYAAPKESRIAPLQPRSGAGELAPALQGGPITNVPCAVSGNWPTAETLKRRGELAAQQMRDDYLAGRYQ